MVPQRFLARAAAAGICSITLAGIHRPAWAEPVKLQKGDHISLIGNTLADRMQYFGWVEAALQSRLPEMELSIRDLGYAGDELVLRPRVDGFGTPDEWLRRTQADVIFAFFGFNESFGGKAGVDKFKTDLQSFIKATLAKQYNEKSAPRLVLFSPIAAEDMKSPNYPDGKALNENIKLYRDAMEEVAKSANVQFIDLYGPTAELYKAAKEPLTTNGVHLSDAGYKALSQVIANGLLGEETTAAKRPSDAVLEKVRQAVLDKDLHWLNRYRTLDGYNVYGGRSYEKYADDITNRTVLQREMEVLDVMTANRDKAVWAAAKGQEYKIDDSNTPQFIPVRTNKPGPGPNGEYTYLGGEEAIKKMTLAPHMKVNLFASEEQFPELINPVQMAFDTKGRLWVATWQSYPHWKPKDPFTEKLLILEDADGDGKADKRTIFADNLNCITGFEFNNGGVLVAQAPELVFLKDTNNDDKADVTLRVLDGIDSGDSHHTANSFVFDPGGALYFQEGTFHRSSIESPYGLQRNRDGAVWRYEPLTAKIEPYIAFNFANPHGHVFDHWGQDVVHDGTGANPYWGTAFSTKTYYPQKHRPAPQLYKQRTRPCPGTEILSSRHFPEANQGNLLVGNVIGLQGILQYKITDKDSGYDAKEVETVIESSDPNFRPADIEMGPDGAIYFVDWQNAIIGHLQHHLRDPSRDKTHGRVYRITYEGRELLKPAKIAGEPIEKLLDLLKEPEDRVRYRAKIELSAHKAEDVVKAVDAWAAKLDKKDPNYAHNQLEALWVKQYHNRPDEALLKEVLRSPDFRARAAATKVLCYWREQIKEPLALLKTQVNDENPRVRLEAVRACSFFTTPRAAELALESLNHPQDENLKYVLDETMRTLDRFTKQVGSAK